MGRGNGHSEPVGGARRVSSPAEALGIAGNPKYQRGPVPNDSPIINVRGQALYRAIGNAVPIPSMQIAGERVYPHSPRKGRAKLDGQFWQRMVRAGHVYSAEELAASLWQVGVGTDALDGSGNQRLGESRVREEFHAWCYECLIPGGSGIRAGDDESDEEGFGVFRDRAAAREYVRSRQGRVAAQRQSLRGLLLGSPFFFAASEADRRSWPVEKVSGEQLARVLDTLADEEAKNLRIAEALFGPELTQPQRERALKAKASAVRGIVHRLRKAGVPIIASPGGGYSLAENELELREYVEAEMPRMDAVSDQSKRLELAAARWWPETPEEEAAALVWRSQLNLNERSPHALRRDQQRSAQKAKREAEKAAARREAAEREWELMSTPEWKQANAKRGSGIPLNSSEAAFMKDLAAIRKQKRSGVRPAAKKAASTPAAPRSNVSIPRPPWEYPQEA